MLQPAILTIQTEPTKEKPVKKKKFAIGEIVGGGISGLFSGIAGLFKPKKEAQPKERYQVVVDNRTRGINLTYIIAILTVVIVVIVIMWVGIKKLKAKK